MRSGGVLWQVVHQSFFIERKLDGHNKTPVSAVWFEATIHFFQPWLFHFAGREEQQRNSQKMGLQFVRSANWDHDAKAVHGIFGVYPG